MTYGDPAEGIGWPRTIARHRVYDAIRAAVRRAADFELSAQNIDRPIVETPWLADHRYGDGEYDARWYPVQGVVAHVHEGIAVDEALERALLNLEAVARVDGEEASL